MIEYVKPNDLFQYLFPAYQPNKFAMVEGGLCSFMQNC